MIDFKTRYLNSLDINNAVDMGEDIEATPFFDICVNRETMLFIEDVIKNEIREAANADNFEAIIVLADSLQKVRRTIEAFDEMVENRRNENERYAKEGEEGETE